MSSRRKARSSSKNNTTKDNIDSSALENKQTLGGSENVELTGEEMIELERLERKRIRQQRRDDRRLEILKQLNINGIESLQGGPSSHGNVCFHAPDCPWRENMISPIQQYLDREEESHEAKLKRNKIPPKKINDMIARWILTLVSIHTHHKNTNESLAHVVYKERVKASKGLKSIADNYIMSLLDTVVRLSHLPRVCVFGKVAGLYPEDGYPFYPESAKILVYLVKLCFGMQTASAERMEENGSVWLSAEVADTCVQSMFDQNPYWNLEKWHNSCTKYNVNLPWSNVNIRSDLAANLASIMTTVGDIDAKDRRRLPSDIRGAGVTQIIIDADRLMDVMFSAFVSERCRVERELEEAEIHRLKVQRRIEQTYQQQLRNVQLRPFVALERHYLKKGVKRFGVGSWKRILNDKRYVLVHRTEEILEQEWRKIAARRDKREKRRWDWRRWPWNPEWEWGGLIVSQDDSASDATNADIDLWSLIEGQGYYESEDDVDEDEFDSDSTHYTDSSEGECFEEDDNIMENVPQIIDNTNMYHDQEKYQKVDSTSENMEMNKEDGDSFFVTSGGGKKNGRRKRNIGGMMQSSSAPALGAKMKKSPYVVS